MAFPAFDPNSNELTTDSQYLALNPGWVKAAHDLLVHYGIIPATGSTWADSATAAEIQKNPYSVAALLGKGLQTTRGSNMNLANTGNALSSGAYANSQLIAQDRYQQDLGTAGEQLQGSLNDISGQRTNTLLDIWNRLSSQPVDPDTSVPGPTATSTSSAATNIGFGAGAGAPQPQGPYTRTGPEAGGQVVKALKKPGARGGQAKPVSYTGRAL